MWYLGLANTAMTVSDAEKTLMVQNLYVWVDLITMISAEETKPDYASKGVLPAGRAACLGFVHYPGARSHG